MSQTEPAAAPPQPPSETAKLREDIAETREDLGGTVEALAQKADVKSQVAQKREDAKARVQSSVAGLREKATANPATQQAAERPWIPAAAGAGLLLLVAWRRRRA